MTFDSGGLNIKPEQYMKTMKSDKAGACAVLGIMKAVGELKPDVEVHGIIPTVENMPDGKAYRPDDIIVTGTVRALKSTQQTQKAASYSQTLSSTVQNLNQT